MSDTNGNLYGTTGQGGKAHGAVFEIAPNGTETVLYSFLGEPDGAQPLARLLIDSSGNLYGTTVEGGVSCSINSNGCGTVFKVTPTGSESVLYAFLGGNDGDSPLSTLISDQAGNLYGTTDGGGGCSEYEPDGCGTVFKVSPKGKETILHAFQGHSDGSFPAAGLVMDSAGNLYGTTNIGGRDKLCEHVGQGCGTVFKVAKNGVESVVYSFKVESNSPPRGALPYASVLLQNDVLYGITTKGGNGNNGVVFGVNSK